jgi:hypothetical protein
MLGLSAAALLVLSSTVPQSPARATCVCLGGGLLSLLALREALHGRPLLFDVALAGLLSLYAYARLGLLWPSPGLSPFDLAATLGAALSLLLLERTLGDTRPEVSPPLLRFSFLLPLIAVALSPRPLLSWVAFGAALVHGLLAWVRRPARHSRLAAVSALLLVDVSLFATWAEHGVSDEQLYTIPLGLSLLLAAQLSRGELGRPQLQWLRALGCLVLYAGTGLQMARSDTLLFPLVLGLLSLLTVLAGALLRVRAFLFLGAATLVVDALANLARFSLHSSRVLAVVATLAGLLTMAVMAVVSVQRARATALYRRLWAALEDWE